jgi:amino acid transporter
LGSTGSREAGTRQRWRHVIGADKGSTNPVGLYAECSTMGTIVILFVYFLTTLSLPVFMWRRHQKSFSVLRHVAIPVLGATALIVPFIELFKPGQPAPYAEFPYTALAILAAATVIAWVTVHRHPSTHAFDLADTIALSSDCPPTWRSTEWKAAASRPVPA